MIIIVSCVLKVVSVYLTDWVSQSLQAPADLTITEWFLVSYGTYTGVRVRSGVACLVLWSLMSLWGVHPRLNCQA